MKGAWVGLTGKKKYIVGGLYAILVASNKVWELGLDEATLDRILWTIALVLGIDGAEGAAANFKKK